LVSITPISEADAAVLEPVAGAVQTEIANWPPKRSGPGRSMRGPADCRREPMGAKPGRAGSRPLAARCAAHGRGYLRIDVHSGCRAEVAIAGTEVAVGVVAKVRDKAAGFYEQAKARYADRNARQRAGQQASHMTSRIRDLSGKAKSSQVAGKLRDASGKATSSQVAGKLRDASGKATSSQLAGKLRDASGKATSSQLAGKLRDASGKATAAVKDARARRHAHQ
jgi:uncharacterized protein YjbJ (UPF0337 family)